MCFAPLRDVINVQAKAAELEMKKVGVSASTACMPLKLRGDKAVMIMRVCLCTCWVHIGDRYADVQRLSEV